MSPDLSTVRHKDMQTENGEGTRDLARRLLGPQTAGGGVTRSVRRYTSELALSSTASSLVQMNSMLTVLIMRYSRSSVLRRSVSSGSSRQSMTASWCSAAYLGWPLTISARPVMPRYLRLWLSDEMKRAIELAAWS